MATVNKVTKTLFDQIKSSLEFIDPLTAAQVNHLSVKTILQIKGSENYADYEAQKKAQHPPTKSSMREELVLIRQMCEKILELSKENRLL